MPSKTFKWLYGSMYRKHTLKRYARKLRFPSVDHFAFFEKYLQLLKLPRFKVEIWYTPFLMQRFTIILRIKTMSHTFLKNNGLLDFVYS